MKIAIIGGGVAGLSAAWELEKSRRAGAPTEYRLFEREPRLGGVIRTDRLPDGSLLEAGPDSFLTEKPWAAALCRELGLGDQLITSNDTARRTHILVRGRLEPLPDGLQFFVPTKLAPIVRSRLFSLSTKAGFIREYLFGARETRNAERGTPDESVAAFVERHFGSEVADRLADPLLGGIYGGRAGELSVAAVLPRMLQMEREHGSLTRAMIAARKNAPPRGNAPLFTTLRNGMQQMTDALAAQLHRDCLRTSTNITALELSGKAWYVHTGNQEQRFDAVILALPAWAAAGLVRAASPPLAKQLAGINYSSSITVNLAFAESAIPPLPRGFGFLVPRLEGKKMLACTFAQNKFPHRAPPGRAVFRCFFAAGEDDAALLDRSDDELTNCALSELSGILGIGTAPDAVRVNRWRRTMPQYGPGHLQRIAEIDGLRRTLPNLALAGNFMKGIGVPDCIRSGAEAAEFLYTSRLQ